MPHRRCLRLTFDLDMSQDRVHVPDGARSCTDLIRLDGKRRRVRIIVCQVQTSDAVRLSTHTADCNVISSTKICIVYPNLTNNRRYMVTRHWIVRGLVKPLKRRKFYKQKGHPEHHDRRVFDNRCMVLDWTRGDSKKSKLDWMAEGTFRI